MARSQAGVQLNRGGGVVSGPTRNQLAAITAAGDVLVEAGAGAGKTRTLVERCLARILDEADPVSLDEMLLVTFTEAAAAEMRRRIREALERRTQEARSHPAEAESPRLQRLEEQLALLDTARISTLHGFCLQLVREHFFELEIDPQISVLDEAQARMLAGETLDELMQAHYAGKTSADIAIQELILAQGGGWDGPIRDLVRKLHEYTQTLAHPERWFEEQQETFRSADASQWWQWLLDAISGWRLEWMETLANEAAANPNAQQCLAALRALPEAPTREQVAATLAAILTADGNWPKGKKTALRKPLARLFEEAAFLESLATVADGKDPLAEDWEWVRRDMTTLLDLAQEFTGAFGQAKRESGAVDFHDLEQFALRLLWDQTADQPTLTAQHWRGKLRLVFVDEYQDINAAQDQIIAAVSRAGAAANRFLVGDVKQSIYRFRLANPRIFQGYASSWRKGVAHHQVIPLAENFRSHEALLNFVNPVFTALMRTAIGGVAYDEEARLRFGDRPGRAAMTVAAAASSAPRVELHLRLASGDNAAQNEEENGNPSLADLSNTEREARLVALRLKQLRTDGFPVWDKDAKSHRPVDWHDMVVLLRSPRSKAESFAKEFTRLGVPLEVERGGFYETTEISDLLNLLNLLDNPLQDVPALAVLRSPLAGLTLGELASIRLAAPRERFWTALCRWHDLGRAKFQIPDSNEDSDSGPQPPIAEVPKSALRVPHFDRVDLFLRRFARWRQLARQGSLSRCLETVLDETHYEDGLLAQPRGEQRRANVQRLLAMTRQFDQLQRQGLFRFLRFVEAEQRAGVDPEPAVVESSKAVRLLSIHKSKGLEFPVVVIADLGAPFNLADTRSGIILDEVHGLCPQVKPPATGQRYPSLPYWLAARRQKRELLGEELRLLYVAMTRACDQLILTGTASRKAVEEKWSGASVTRLANAQVLAAHRYLDWLGPLLPGLTGTPDWAAQAEGRSALLDWRVLEAETLPAPQETAAGEEEEAVPDAESLLGLDRRLGWRYANPTATLLPAKTSVSALRRRWEEELDDEAEPLFRAAGLRLHGPKRGHKSERGLSAAEIGTAHHKFLQLVSLDCANDPGQLKREAGRLVAEQALTEAEAEALDLSAVAAFWKSEIGQRIREQAGRVRRELPFTARFSTEELRRFGGTPASQRDAAPAEEYAIVQGVADLAVLLEREIWLVDFKTDQLSAKELPAKVQFYEPQLTLYAQALERIYQRPVTERWLHFLGLGRSVRIDHPPGTTSSQR